MDTKRSGITAAAVQVGDVIDTFQNGRLYVAEVDTTGSGVVITSTYGLVWRTSKDQFVARITFGA